MSPLTVDYSPRQGGIGEATISNEITATGRATHAYFGLQTTPISAESAAQADVPQGCSSPGPRPAAWPRLRARGRVT
jgi:hypothetical protein